MASSQVLAGFHALLDVIGLPGNLLVIVTIALERRFHVMRHILLSSLAVSDFLCLILVNSFLIASTAQERWLHGQTMCYLHPCFLRYFYLNTVLHLIAVSYDRYNAIARSPLTYNGTITKSRVAIMALIWIAPIPFTVSPFLEWGRLRYLYNSEAFVCVQTWSAGQNESAIPYVATVFSILMSFVAPFLFIALMNWSVLKKANYLQADIIQVGTHADSGHQLQERARRITQGSCRCLHYHCGIRSVLSPNMNN